MDWILTIVLPVATGIIGAVGTWVVSFCKEKWANQNSNKVVDNSQDVAVHDQALKIYQDIINGLRIDIAKLEDGYNKLESSAMDTKIENAILKTQLQGLPCQKVPPNCDKGYKV